MTAIPTHRVARCAACGDDGVPLYAGLQDRLFGAPGAWDMARCPTCALLWLDPSPDEDAIGAAYENYYTHSGVGAGGLRARLQHWRNRYVGARLGYRPTPLEPVLTLAGAVYPGGDAELLRDALYLRAPGARNRLLEIGCGSGETLAYLRSLGWNVTGLEVDPRAVEVAQARGLSVHAGQMAEAAFPDASFDVVVMVHVIEHVHDPRRLLGEVARVLAPGGLLRMLTPNTESLAHRRFGASWVSLDAPRHLHLFNARNLSRLACEAGLSVTEARSTVRGARSAYFQSRVISKYGRWNSGGVPGVAQHLRGLPFQLEMRLRLALGRPVGEELLVSALRTAA